jgi:hypothetical protein
MRATRAPTSPYKLILPKHMEPSTTDEIIHDIYSALRRARHEESYVPMRRIAETITDALYWWEYTTLIELIRNIDHEREPAREEARKRSLTTKHS